MDRFACLVSAIAFNRVDRCPGKRCYLASSSRSCRRAYGTGVVFFRAVPCCVFRSWLLGVLVTEDFHCTSSIYYNLLHTVSQPASRSSRVETERERSIWSEPAEINFTPLILSVFCLVLIVLFEGHHQFLREVRFLSLHPKASVGLAVAKARRYLL